jgi:uncharacterized protein
MGIYSGLRRIGHQAAFVCAADMPFLSAEVIRAQFQELDGHDIVVPCPGHRPEFLHAIYRQSCLPLIRQTLEADLFKIEILTQSCRTLRLDGEWFRRRGLAEKARRAFTNINTHEDYLRWGGDEELAPARPRPAPEPREGEAGPDALRTISPQVVSQVRRTLIQQESAYQSRFAGEEISSLWAHSSRVGRIAHHLARAEGLEPEPALLAGLLHDTGKFANGSYHEDEVPEERNAVAFVQRILEGTPSQGWIPLVSQAILSMYLEDEATTDLGRVAYDADCLDKLGCMGVGQFFAKNALRRRFLNDDLMMRASIELTYAYHAPDTLKTATGRSLARQRGLRTRSFYTDLLAEWAQLGLGAYEIVEEDIGGIACILVVPRACSCGGGLRTGSDIQDALKCRSVVVRYHCPDCGAQSEYSFCLPRVKGLPPKP